jgi:hypothetical protein
LAPNSGSVPARTVFPTIGRLQRYEYNTSFPHPDIGTSGRKPSAPFMAGETRRFSLHGF